MPAELAERLQGLADPALLRRAHALLISAPDRSAAIEQLRSLLSPSSPSN